MRSCAFLFILRGRICGTRLYPDRCVFLHECAEAVLQGGEPGLQNKDIIRGGWAGVKRERGRRLRGCGGYGFADAG